MRGNPNLATKAYRRAKLTASQINCDANVSVWNGGNAPAGAGVPVWLLRS